jgi:hypothetical protein
MTMRAEAVTAAAAIATRSISNTLLLCCGEVCLACQMPIYGHGWRLEFRAGRTHAHLDCLPAARALLRPR